MSEYADKTPRDLARFQIPLLAVGIFGLILCLIGAIFSPAQFFRSYLLGYMFWAGLALGSLGILMMQHLTGGAWGLIIRRALESATTTIPLMVILFVPLLFGLRSLYIWTQPEVMASDPLLENKSGYLNIPFFLGRAAIYFAVWVVTAYLLNRWSLEQDETGEPRFALLMQRLSGPGLFVLAVTLSLALIDWIMSLEPRWYSTIYALIFIAGEGLAAFAFSIGVVILLADREPFARVIKEKHLNDLGNLMLAFVMLWAYCSFAQFLLIWTGNLREEVGWYLPRIGGGWKYVAAALILFHFFLPFYMLLSRKIKRDTRKLAIVVVVIILMRFVDLVWLIEPAFYPQNLSLHWMDFIATIGIGGIWLAVFLRQLNGRPLLPLNDPYAEKAFEDEQ